MNNQAAAVPSVIEMDSQRRKRRDAVDFARASIGLEGFTISQQTEALAARFVDREMDLATFIKMNIELIAA